MFIYKLLYMLYCTFRTFHNLKPRSKKCIEEKLCPRKWNLLFQCLSCRIPYCLKNCTKYRNQQSCVPSIQKYYCIDIVGPFAYFLEKWVFIYYIYIYIYINIVEYTCTNICYILLKKKLHERKTTSYNLIAGFILLQTLVGWVKAIHNSFLIVAIFPILAMYYTFHLHCCTYNPIELHIYL